MQYSDKFHHLPSRKCNLGTYFCKNGIKQRLIEQLIKKAFLHGKFL